MITIEELSAYNRKLVDENLKLRKEKTNLEEIIACLRENEAKQVKDKEWLSSVIEKRNKRIDELQKETTALKNEIVNLKGVIESLSEQRDRLEKEKCELLGIIQGKDKAIADLKKENAELKKRNGELAGQKASLERWFGEAKSIIREYVDYPTSNDELWKLHEKAEAFLEE